MGAAVAGRKSTGKEPTPLDLHIARRIRERRIDIGMSQSKLAAAADVSFQQIQKYENGRNRIAPGRLQPICDALAVKRDYLFEGFDEAEVAGGFAEGPAAPYETDGPTAREGHALVEAFSRIKDPSVRANLLSLVRSMADMQPATGRARKSRSQD